MALCSLTDKKLKKMKNFLLISLLIFPFKAISAPVLDITPGVTCEEAHDIEKSLKYDVRNVHKDDYIATLKGGDTSVHVERKFQTFDSRTFYSCYGNFLSHYRFQVSTSTSVEANELAKAWVKIIQSKYGIASMNTYVPPSSHKLRDSIKNGKSFEGDAFVLWKLAGGVALYIIVEKNDNGYILRWTWDQPNTDG